MKNIPKNVSEKLINLLYTTTSTEVATKVPIVTKYLYEQQLDESRPQSLLDDLMENEWKQRRINFAVDDLPKVSSTEKKSNILKFNCQNSYITAKDFYNIYPINRERKYYLSNDLRKGIKFEVVKSRNPDTLLSNGSYYLIFPNYIHACVYWLETLGKNLNGFSLNLEFIEANSHELRYMSSPFLDSSINESSYYLSNTFNRSDSNKVPLSEIFKHSKSKRAILEQISKIEENKKQIKYFDLDKDPNYNLLLDLADVKKRNNYVLVRNLPFGLSKFTLPKLVWDYDLESLDNISNCFTTIASDSRRQVSLHLIRFANNTNAARFVRNFHGRKWDSIQSEKEKKVYEPILCEILD